MAPAPFFRFQRKASIKLLCLELDYLQARLERRGPLSRRWKGQLRRELEAEAVAASVSMEQVPVTVDEVRRILAGGSPASVSEPDQALVRGYREAMEFVLRRADDPTFQWNWELIVGLHDRVLAGDFAAGAGRLAAGARWVTDGSGAIVFEPAAEAELPALVDRACEQLAEMTSSAHPAMSAAWAHVVIAAIHPFRDGNGRVARVLASLAMYRGGFQRTEFTSLEEWWGRHLGDYYSAFACLGKRFDPAADVTPFVEAHIQAQLSQARALALRERVERRLWAALEIVTEDTSLPARVIYALWDAFFDREVTSGYYTPLADVSRQTASHDFASLVASGLLISEGARRWRTYRASPVLFKRIATELGLDLPENEGRDWLVHSLASDAELADDLV